VSGCSCSCEWLQLLIATTHRHSMYTRSPACLQELAEEQSPEVTSTHHDKGNAFGIHLSAALSTSSTLSDVHNGRDSASSAPAATAGLEGILDWMHASQQLFLGQYTMNGACDRFEVGQGLVQFCHCEASGEDYAIKCACYQHIGAAFVLLCYDRIRVQHVRDCPSKRSESAHATVNKDCVHLRTLAN
jgi:hypothetical protein